MDLPTWDEASGLVEQWRQNHKDGTVVFTNGCFDLLHVGHLSYLEEAKSLGGFLVVGLNSDESVRRLKGTGRPILPLSERGRLLKALRCVDMVVAFQEDTPLDLIKKIQPDVLVKGGDWDPKDIVGSDFVLGRGGAVKSLGFIAGKSTTEIIHQIQQMLQD